MLIEINDINNLNKKNGVVVYENKSFKIISYDELIQKLIPFDKERSILIAKVEDSNKKMARITNQHLNEKVDRFTSSMLDTNNKIKYLCAFESLQTAVNFGEIVLDDNVLDDIRKFVLEPTKFECPEPFKPYLEKFSIIEPKFDDLEDVEVKENE
jgi:hypothetical protein